MANTGSTVWQPILTSSSSAASAWAAIDDVARAIVDGDYLVQSGSRERGEDHALLYAYLAVARSDYAWATRATECLNSTIDKVAESPQRWLGLLGGLCGLGWTVQHLSRLLDRAFPVATGDDLESPDDDDGTDGGDLAGDIDAAVLQELRRMPAGARIGDYDLVSGLVGYGTYFLERWPAEKASAGVELVIDHLVATAERTNSGITWHTPPELLPEWQRNMCPAGYYNLGVAHGVPGVIHFLAEATAAVEHEGAQRLLDGALDWLLAQRRPKGSISWFSGWVAPGQSDDSRLGWCYGDLGILSVLFQVAARTGREDLRHFAGDLLDHCIARKPEESRVADAPFCHGAVGAAHIFNRLYQTENDLRCRDAALAWFDRALAMRQPTSAAGGFLAATRPDPEGPTVWEASPAFLDGAIGVALALLSAVTAIEPSWDRLLLVSGRKWA